MAGVPNEGEFQVKTVWITSAVAVLFLALAVVRIARDGRIEPAPRVWLLTGGIFGAVSLYLWLTLPP